MSAAVQRRLLPLPALRPDPLRVGDPPRLRARHRRPRELPLLELRLLLPRREAPPGPVGLPGPRRSGLGGRPWLQGGRRGAGLRGRVDLRGRPGRPAGEAAGTAVRIPFEFTLKIPVDAEGLRLRILFDQAEGNRAADVFIDGVRAAATFRAGSNARRRLREEDIEIPPQLAAGKTSVRVRVVPLNGALADFGGRDWSAGRTDAHFAPFTRRRAP